MHAAIFLDRDGVIIENRPEYVRSWEDVEILPGAIDSLVQLARTPLRIVIVTNQSAVGRGIISIQAAGQINDRLVKLITDAGGRVDGVFMCPHAPEEGCTCRKPQPGLLLQAAESLQIDLKASVMIGDALSDLQAGAAAGVGRLALVLTGRGEAQAAGMHAAGMRAVLPFSFVKYTNLAEALQSLF